MQIRARHNVVLLYVEWCIANREPWPKLRKVAHDTAWDESEIAKAMGELEAAGLLTVRYVGDKFRRVVRLGDGRFTRVSVPDIRLIHRDGASSSHSKNRPDGKRIAA